MAGQYSSLHASVKALAKPVQPRVETAKPSAARAREGIQISSRLVSDILRPVKNLRLIRD